MNVKVISRNVGSALLVSALFMFLSILVSVAGGNDSALAALIISFLITFIIGIFPFIFIRRSSVITLKDGYMIIFLSWLLSFVFGMLPYALWGGPFTIVNAWFESVSGLTTTGATILEEVEALPRSLLFWRASTHFIGGLGVVVFLLLIIPESSPIRLRLTNMELSSISREGYRTQARKTVSIFATVYLVNCLAAFVTYMIVGLSPFDAICHAFSVCASGGFSTRTLSIGAFGNVAAEIVTIFFMFIASIHFGLVFMTFVTKSLKPLNHPVLKFYVTMLAILIVVTCVSLKFNGIQPTWGKALLDSSFTVVSYDTTTGFALSDNAAWPMLPCFVLIIVSLVCGCAGSTTGGVKIDRILVLMKAVRRQISRTLHPTTVSGIRMGGTLVRDEEVYPQILYLALFMIFLVVSIGLCMLTGSGSTEAVTGSLACLSNVGPSLGSIGSLGNYNAMPSAIKVIFTVDMFLGRVEIYPVLAVLMAGFTYKSKR
jgi:trk system potassium uptake protein TrkH